MTIKDITDYLEQIAPLQFQEPYDNSGLLIGNNHVECTGILVCLDINLAIIREAELKKCNLIISHHPIIFSSVKKILTNSQQGSMIATAIKNDISIYAIHTNLDNTINGGLNEQWSKILNLENISPLVEKENSLKKIFFFVPEKQLNIVRNAIFKAGAGQVGNYSECSFTVIGEGSFNANEKAKPFVGKNNQRHYEKEVKVEIIYPVYLEKEIITELIKTHPYEEVAYDLINLTNKSSQFGSGIIGSLSTPIDIEFLFKNLQNKMNVKVLKHSLIIKKEIRKIALCGGAGAFLISNALEKKADVFITADLKYHDYFKAENKIMLIDIGHYESESHCVALLYGHLHRQFESINIFKTEVNANPVYYYF